MENYKQLAIIYLKANKRRCFVTILGVVVAVAILYAGLNVALNYYDDGLAKAREEQNYELCFFADTKEQRENICNDEEVVSAYIGSSFDYVEGKEKDGVVFVNTKHPFSMMKIMNRMEAQYGVRGDYNGELALYYFASEDVNGIFLMAGFIVWIAFIFAIVGVGIIRNSIQLNSLEHVKDFGILRCVGATKGQLRSLVYIMGSMQELIGVVVGLIIGYPLSAYICFMCHASAGFHWLPVIFVVGAYLFDLYFAMKECCKFVDDMTPVSAVRGEFRIRKEKIKIRKNRFVSKVFGVEGDYAYKSLRRNPGRFRKSVVTIGFGVAACIVVIWLIDISNKMVKAQTDMYGHYQLVLDSGYSFTYGPIKNDVYFGNPELIKKFGELDCVREIKYRYSGLAMTVDQDEFFSHVTEKNYLDQSMVAFTNGSVTELEVEGMNEDELKELNSYLVDGSLDLSENGIVAIRNGYFCEFTDDTYYLTTDKMDYGQLMNYKVGDKVKLMDPQQFNQRMDERVEQDEKEHPEKYEDMAKKYERRMEFEEEVHKELVEEGAYQIYTVEALIDAEQYGIMLPVFITGLSTYSKMTGHSEDQMTGIGIHVDEKRITDNAILQLTDLCENAGMYVESECLGAFSLSNSMRKAATVIAGIVAFIVCMASLNIINTTASSLYLRKKEFAQLRVIGMSKKRLIYTALLEGIITTIGANVIGIVIGVGVMIAFYPIIQEIYPIGIVVPWHAILVGLIGSGLILCGSVYVPLRELPIDVSSDLTTDGD